MNLSPQIDARLVSVPNPQSDSRVELKFLIDRELADKLRDWARVRLAADPHAEPEGPQRDSYPISTLYLDTVDRDLFHRSGQVGLAKHRVRRYGDGATIWLETKRKRKDLVKKRRVAIGLTDWRRLLEEIEVASPTDVERTSPPDRLAGLASDTSALDWQGTWFESRVTSRQLLPAAMIQYRRFARIGGEHAGEPFRLTIDRELSGQLCDQWRLPNGSSGTEPLPMADELLELKFTRTMPVLFKELLAKFPLVATGFSKYRTCMNHFLAS